MLIDPSDDRCRGNDGIRAVARGRVQPKQVQGEPNRLIEAWRKYDRHSEALDAEAPEGLAEIADPTASAAGGRRFEGRGGQHDGIVRRNGKASRGNCPWNAR